MHGNFIVNDGGATAAEVLELIEKIQETARTKRGIELETEVQIVGETGMNALAEKDRGADGRARLGAGCLARDRAAAWPRRCAR